MQSLLVSSERFFRQTVIGGVFRQTVHHSVWKSRRFPQQFVYFFFLFSTFRQAVIISIIGARRCFIILIPLVIIVSQKSAEKVAVCLVRALTHSTVRLFLGSSGAPDRPVKRSVCLPLVASTTTVGIAIDHRPSMAVETFRLPVRPDVDPNMKKWHWATTNE